MRAPARQFPVSVSLRRPPLAATVVRANVGNISTMAGIADARRTRARSHFFPGRIQAAIVAGGILKVHYVDYVVNLTAEPRNDRTILDPGSFIHTSASVAR
jgi:dTDP-D-glucose 4,6-dehydratase